MKLEKQYSFLGTSTFWFSCKVMSNSLRPCELQHVKPAGRPKFLGLMEVNYSIRFQVSFEMNLRCVGWVHTTSWELLNF